MTVRTLSRELRLGVLETFLEEQLAASFKAFKSSEHYKEFSMEDSANSNPAEDDTTLEMLNAAGNNADKSAAGGSGDANEAEKPDHGTTAADSYADYVPAKLNYGPPHVEHVVESASLACVMPTDITFNPSIPPDAMSSGVLSRVQLEAVVYALQQHEKRLPSGYRAGFFIGDGTGVGRAVSLLRSYGTIDPIAKRKTVCLVYLQHGPRRRRKTRSGRYWREGFTTLSLTSSATGHCRRDRL